MNILQKMVVYASFFEAVIYWCKKQWNVVIFMTALNTFEWTLTSVNELDTKRWKRGDNYSNIVADKQLFESLSFIYCKAKKFIQNHIHCPMTKL